MQLAFVTKISSYLGSASSQQ